jgi:hypothetical protein
VPFFLSGVNSMYFRFSRQIFAPGKSRDQFNNSLPSHKKKKTKFRLIYNYLLEIGEKYPLPVFDITSMPGGSGMAYITIKAKIDSFNSIVKENRSILSVFYEYGITWFKSY